MEAYGGSGSGNEEASNSRRGKRQYHRHSAQQIQQLEEFFKDCPHPDENQRRQLSRDIGLDAKQIKFWFQNKRTQKKAQNEKEGNSVLRAENERIISENFSMRESLRNILCSTCNGSSYVQEQKQLNLQRLMIENARLKEQREKTLNFISSRMGKSAMPLPGIQHVLNMPGKSSLSEGMSIMPRLSETPASPYRLSGMQEVDKSVIIETAVAAMDELVELLRLKEPVWINSPTDGRYFIHNDSYDKLYPKSNLFRSAGTRMESSQASGEVAMAAIHLVEMFLDSNKWKDMFPSIVTKARTIEAVDTGNVGGSLRLMYEKMHILSPLVAPREFFFIRYCGQLNASTWVMVDVSYDFIKQLQDSAPTRSWKLPSGCTIEDLSNGKSIVTWMEHVQVEDKTSTHRLYRDLVCSCQAYGASRWIATLQRMCERFTFSMGPTVTPKSELDTVIDSTGGRRNLMKLSHRMVKNFCEVLGVTDRPDNLPENNGGVRVSIRKSTGLGQPDGLIITAAKSVWLPISNENLFNFFIDEQKRAQWDVLSGGNPVNSIARISTGAHPGNCISVIQPYVPKENMLMLQESSIDTVGGMIVYAPIELTAISSATNGEDTMKIPILPSGFVISGDGRAEKGASTSAGSSKSGGSLLTVAFQILVGCSSLSKQLNMQSVATVHALITSTIQKIEEALECSGLD